MEKRNVVYLNDQTSRKTTYSKVVGNACRDSCDSMCWCHAHAMANHGNLFQQKSGNIRSLSRRRYQQRLSFLRFVATTTSYSIPEQAVPETKQQGNVVIIESPKPETTTEDPITITSTEPTVPAQASYILQVRSYPDPDSADARRAEIILNGLSADVVKTVENGQTWYRVSLVLMIAKMQHLLLNKPYNTVALTPSSSSVKTLIKRENQSVSLSHSISGFKHIEKAGFSAQLAETLDATEYAGQKA